MKIEIDGIEFKDNLDEICFLEAKKNGDEMILFYTGAYMAARRAFLEYGKKKTIKIEKLRKMIEIDSFLLKNLNVFSLKMLKILIMRESIEEEKLINNRKQLYSDKKFLERHGKFKDFINVALDRFTQQQDIQCVLQKNQIEKNIKKPKKSEILKV